MKKAKKILALLLVAVMVCTLFACTSKEKEDGNTTPSADTSKDIATDTPDAAPDTTDGENDTNTTGGVEDVLEDISANANSVGFFESGVDPNSRDTYEIVWAYMRPMSLFQQMEQTFIELEPIFNTKMTSFCANSDIDAMIQNIELYADQGVDGFIIIIDPTATERIVEVLDDTGLPYVAVLNSARDENGSSIVPTVGIEGTTAGAAITQWMFDNYKTYLGDIDVSEVGLLSFDFSPNVDFHQRFESSVAKFGELVPNNAGVFPADGVSGGLNEQTGYDLASATFAANPDVKYWFVAACLEQYAQGATRAAEQLGIDGRVIITDVSGDILPSDWDSGYEGCWVASLALSAPQYAVPALSAVVAMIDGKATPETLWSTIRAAGDKYTFYNIECTMITIDNYEAFRQEIRELSGLA